MRKNLIMEKFMNNVVYVFKHAGRDDAHAYDFLGPINYNVVGEEIQKIIDNYFKALNITYKDIAKSFEHSSTLMQALNNYVKALYIYGRDNSDYSWLYKFCEGIDLNQLATILSLIQNIDREANLTLTINPEFLRDVHFTTANSNYDEFTIDGDHEVEKTLIYNTALVERKRYEENGSVKFYHSMAEWHFEELYQEIQSYALYESGSLNGRAQMKINDYFINQMQSEIVNGKLGKVENQDVSKSQKRKR